MAGVRGETITLDRNAPPRQHAHLLTNTVDDRIQVNLIKSFSKGSRQAVGAARTRRSIAKAVELEETALTITNTAQSETPEIGLAAVDPEAEQTAPTAGLAASVAGK
jgi:hypothetical protein